MNHASPAGDSDVLRAVSDSMSGVPLAPAPDLADVQARGRAHRRRRVIPTAAGAGTLAAGAALAVTTLLPAGPQPATQLAAWTVARQSDGKIVVTIRELRDPAGLQRTLRADGVPASVTFLNDPNPNCLEYTPTDMAVGVGAVASLPSPRSRQHVFVINPATLPQGVGVAISAGIATGTGPHGMTSKAIMATLTKVLASPACTG